MAWNKVFMKSCVELSVCFDGAFFVAINEADFLVSMLFCCAILPLDAFVSVVMWLGFEGGGMLSIASFTVAANMRSAESPTN